MSKMIRLREGFIMSDCIEAIVPDRSGAGYAIFTIGHVISSTITKSELEDVMWQMEEAAAEDDWYLS